MKRLLAEPLVHFLVLGLGLFLLYQTATDGPSNNEIRVSADQISRLEQRFEKLWKRQPSDKELDALIEDYIAEELLYREAVRLGLDEGDHVVRRRLQQKAEFILTGDSATEPVDEQDLRAFFEDNRKRYRTGDRITFRQVFLGTDPTPAQRAEAQRLVDPRDAAQPTLLPPRVALATEATTDARFGRGFFASIWPLSPGSWSPPLQSAHGWHLVFVDKKQAGRLPDLRSIERIVARDFKVSKQRQARRDLIDRLKQSYTITIKQTTP